MKIQLKRSNVVEGSPAAAKKPTAAQMEYGELAVNYSNEDPAIFLKDSNDQIIRIGGLGAVGYDLLGGDGIDVDISGKDVTFSVDLAGGDDGLEFVGSALDKLSASIASDSVLGSVKIGDNLDIQTDGVLSGKIPVIISDTTPPVEEGYLWFNSSSGQSFVGYVDPSNDEYWVNISKPGPQGLTGVKGDKGDKGDKGNTGSPGTTDPNDILYTYPGGVEQTVQARLEQYLSIVDFGAVADGVYGFDGRTTPGSTNGQQFNADSYTFTSDDIGKCISVVGAHVDGSWGGKVGAILGPHTVRIDQGGQRTIDVTNARWCMGTDNAAAFQAVSDYAKTKYETTGESTAIYIPDGNYALDSLVTAYSHQTWSGAGRSSIILCTGKGSGIDGGYGVFNDRWKVRQYKDCNQITRGDEFITMTNPADATYIGTGQALLRDRATIFQAVDEFGNPVAHPDNGKWTVPQYCEQISITSIDATTGRLYLEDPIIYSYSGTDGFVAKQNDWDQETPTKEDNLATQITFKDLVFFSGAAESGGPSISGYKNVVDNVTLFGLRAGLAFNNINRCLWKNIHIYAMDRCMEWKTGSLNSRFEDIYYSRIPIPKDTKWDPLVGGFSQNPVISVGESAKGMYFKNIFVDAPGFVLKDVFNSDATCECDYELDGLTVRAKTAQNIISGKNPRVQTPVGNYNVKNVYADVDECERLIKHFFFDDSDGNIATTEWDNVYFEDIRAREDTVITNSLISIDAPYANMTPNIVLANIRGNGSVLITDSRNGTTPVFPSGVMRDCVTGPIDSLNSIGLKVINNTRYGEGELLDNRIQTTSNENVSTEAIYNTGLLVSIPVWKSTTFPAWSNYALGLDYIKFEAELYINGTGDHFFTIYDGVNETPMFSVSNTDKELVLIEGSIKVSDSPLKGYITTVKFISNSGGTRIETMYKSCDPKNDSDVLNALPLEFRVGNEPGSNTIDIRSFYVAPYLFG